MSDYLPIPITVEPEQIIEDVYADMEAAFPGWEPAPANPETFLIRALAYRMIGPLAELAADVPAEIFRKWGEAVVGVLPILEAPATGEITVTALDTLGYVIPAGTEVDIQVTGSDALGFRTVSDNVIEPGTSSTSGILIEAVDPGVAGNGLTGTVSPVDALAFIDSVSLDGPTAGGTDAEDPLIYLGRLVETLQTLAPRPILPRDVEILARQIAGVARATALDGYDPATDTYFNPRTVSVAVVDAAGNALSGTVKSQVDAVLQDRRELNFIFTVIDPTYSLIDVQFTIVQMPGFDRADVEQNVIDAVTAFLSPANWGQVPPGDPSSWVNRPTAYYQDLVTTVNNQEGVDRYTLLEWKVQGVGAMGTGDLALDGAAPLPRPGTIQVA